MSLLYNLTYNQCSNHLRQQNSVHLLLMLAERVNQIRSIMPKLLYGLMADKNNRGPVFYDPSRFRSHCFMKVCNLNNIKKQHSISFDNRLNC